MDAIDSSFDNSPENKIKRKALARRFMEDSSKMKKVVKSSSSLFIQFSATFSNPDTAKTYIKDISKFIMYLKVVHGDTGLNEVGDEIANEYRQFLSFCGGRDRKPMSEKSINRSMSALSSFFKWLIRRTQIVTENPFSTVSRHKIAKESNTDYFTSEEAMLILKSTKSKTKSDKLHRALLFTMFSTGMRVSEIRNLTIGSYCKKKKQLTGIASKSKIGLLKKLPPKASEALNAYLLVRSPQTSDYENEPLFIHMRGSYALKPLGHKMISLILNKYCELGGIEKNPHPHMIRYTFITNLIRAGVPLPDISDDVGHSSTDMTMRYYKKIAREDRNLSESLSYL
jgi:site-specific recombinase XerD